MGVYARVGVARASAPDAQALSGVSAVGGIGCSVKRTHAKALRGTGGGAVGVVAAGQRALN